MRAALLLSLACLLLVPAAHAKRRPIKLNVLAGKVAKGTEKQTCFPIEFPRKEALDVDHVEIACAAAATTCISTGRSPGP
jgi:hypothetical protein